jgi:hypothetical protein
LEIWPSSPIDPLVASLANLVYELLDAHDDTVELLRDAALDLRWSAHVDYLRRLGRIGRERLAWLDARGAVTPGLPAPRPPAG